MFQANGCENIIRNYREKKNITIVKYREKEYAYKTLQLITPVFIINFNHRFHPLITFFRYSLSLPLNFIPFYDKKTRNWISFLSLLLVLNIERYKKWLPFYASFHNKFNVNVVEHAELSKETCHSIF